MAIPPVHRPGLTTDPPLVGSDLLPVNGLGGGGFEYTQGEAQPVATHQFPLRMEQLQEQGKICPEYSLLDGPFQKKKKPFWEGPNSGMETHVKPRALKQTRRGTEGTVSVENKSCVPSAERSADDVLRPLAGPLRLRTCAARR